MPPENQQPSCGAPSCRVIVDGVAGRLEKTLSKQHDAGIEAIKDLMTMHHNTVRDSIAEIKKAAEKQGDEIFGRLRRVESRQDVIEATAMTETKVKDIVSQDSGVRWARGQKGWAKAVWTAVSIAAIIGAFKIILWISSATIISKATVISK